MTDKAPGPSNAAPGWYNDPTMVGTQRYWDGRRWTEHAAPLGGSARSEEPSATLEAVGWVGAFLFTPVGFVIAIVMLTKGRKTNQAAAMLVVSVGMTVLGLIVAANNSLL